MSGKSMNFEDKKINKSNFYKNKKMFKIDDINVNRILASKKKIRVNINFQCKEVPKENASYKCL